MEKYETKEVVKKEERFIEKSCDICGRITKQDWHNWLPLCDDDNRCKVEVSYEFGSHWPECQSGIRHELDICPQCFVDKILPLCKTNTEGKNYDY